MDFEAGLSKVSAISSASADDMEKLEDKAKQLGKTTSKTATEVTEAMSYQALAGWKVADMLVATEPILRLSEAGNLDLATTSDLVTDSMQAMGVATEDLNRYLDVVAKTQASANTSAQDMLEAYIKVGGTMRNLNVPLEESATYIGALANRGLKGLIKWVA